MAKLKIDLQTGVIEIEGEEKFVQDVYGTLKENFTQFQLGANKSNHSSVIDVEVGGQNSLDEKNKKPRSHSVTRKKESYQIVKNLDLSGKAGGVSLKQFYADKSPTTGQENNLVFVYYLQKVLNLNGISADHVYTCYKDVGAKPPTALKQSLLDTASKKGWLDTSNPSDITVPISGENYVDHDLPKKVKTV